MSIDYLLPEAYEKTLSNLLGRNGRGNAARTIPAGAFRRIRGGVRSRLPGRAEMAFLQGSAMLGEGRREERRFHVRPAPSVRRENPGAALARDRGFLRGHGRSPVRVSSGRRNVPARRRRACSRRPGHPCRRMGSLRRRSLRKDRSPRSRRQESGRTRRSRRSIGPPAPVVPPALGVAAARRRAGDASPGAESPVTEKPGPSPGNRGPASVRNGLDPRAGLDYALIEVLVSV